MAGTSIKVDFADISAKAGLSRLRDGLVNTKPLMFQISQHLLHSTQDRFKSQMGPDGQRWAPLLPAYLRGKRRNQTSVLTRDGELRGKLGTAHDNTSATVGSNRVYAAIHQFGGKTAPHAILPRRKKALAFGGTVVKSVQHPGSNIPARPFLGLSNADESEIVDITLDYLFGLTGRE